MLWRVSAALWLVLGRVGLGVRGCGGLVALGVCVGGRRVPGPGVR